ncbi:MAG: YdcF family protein [Acidaminococcaceae bacterium]|nr:YdcF family protein [Acidaminococcaceae bacterium]
MPRSVAFFEREGVDVIPYPTDYKTSRNLRLNAFVFTPSADCLYHSAIAMKEYLGLVAVKMGWQ